MSQSVVGALRVNLGLDAAQFNKGAKAAQGSAQKLGASLQKIGAAISLVGTGVALALRAQINAADEAGKAAERLGIPVEALSQLRHAADMSGVSMQSLEGGLQRLSRAMVDNPERFSELGISLRDAQGRMRPTVDVLKDLADRLAAMPQGAERTALAMELMGRTGADMLPMLVEGGDAIARMMAEAEALGLTLTKETAAAAAAFNDNLARLRGTLTGLWRQISAALLPVLEDLTNWFVQVSEAFRGMTPQMQTLSAAMAGITVVAGPLIVVLGTLLRSLAMIKVAIAAMLGPWGILAAVIAAAGVAAVHFVSSSEKVKTPVDEARVAMNLLNEAMGTFATASGPRARGEALAVASAYAQQAAQALAAAEAELALMEAEVARFAASAPEQRGVLTGDMEEGAMRRNIASARDEIESLRSSLELARNRVRQGATEITGALSPALAEAAEKAGTLKIELDGLPDSLGGVGGAAREAAIEVEGLDGTLAGLTDTTSQFQDMSARTFADIVTGSRDARSALSQLLRQMANILAQNAFRQLFSGLGSGGGIFGKLFGGFRAEGGPVMAGRAYVVGEQGPEMFVPRGAGQIVPNGAAGASVIVYSDPSVVVQAAEGAAVRVVQRARPGIVGDAVGATYARAREVPIA